MEAVALLGLFMELVELVAFLHRLALTMQLVAVADLVPAEAEALVPPLLPLVAVEGLVSRVAVAFLPQLAVVAVEP
jgi:uncharacterized membrane protein